MSETDGRDDGPDHDRASGGLAGARDVDTSARLARSLADLVEQANETLRTSGGSSATGRLLAGHLGVALDDTILVSTSLPVWQHVSVQRGVDAYLAERGDGPDWFGIASPHRDHMGLRSLLATQGRSGGSTVAAAEYTTAVSGPDTREEVVGLGLVCTHAPDGVPVVLALRRVDLHGPPELSLDVLAADRSVATACADRLRTLIEQHDVIRGQVVSFGTSEHYGNALVTFLPRPRLTADDVVLAPGLLDRIEQHVLGTAEQADALRRSGIHLKRGVLLHGPPGTGKTHTVRYLMSRSVGTTVIVLSGASLRFIEEAAALARRLAPTIVVVEDVDLVGRDRSFSPTGNPLLFTLLDAMDGVASDADVTFLLTTNRAADLEQALVQRPGRVDLAVLIPRPDPAAREQLLRLYTGGAELRADLAPAVAATEGATASALKELMRRAVLAALARRPGGTAADVPPVIDAETLDGEVRRFTSETESLSRALLGAGSDGAGSDGAGSDGDDDGPVVHGPTEPQPGLAPPGVGYRAVRMPHRLP